MGTHAVLADLARVIQLGWSMRPKVFSALDKHGQNGHISSGHINTAETMWSEITMVGVTEQALANLRPFFLFLLEAAAGDDLETY